MFEIAKNTIVKDFDGYIVIIVAVNFRKNFSIKVSWHFRKYFQRKLIPVYTVYLHDNVNSVMVQSFVG